MADWSEAVAVRFGRNLRTCREKAGLSQEALGIRAALHRTEIGLLERAARVPRIDTLIKLAGAIGVPPGNLLDGMSWKPESVSVNHGGFEVHG